jgi:hypothetical protein
MADYYQILGVSNKASQNEIRSAYRKLARQCHPDVSHAPEANEQFALLSQAYKVLSNKELKEIYDLGGEEEIKSQITNQRQKNNIRTQRDAYRSRINRVVDEMLEEERIESKARSHAVMVVATLFTSAFIVSLIKPMILDSIVTKVLAGFLFIFGIRFLYQNLQSILEKYTYMSSIPSVTKMMESPKQPFSRSIALGFLVLGYIVSLILGTTVGYCCFDDGKSGPYLDHYYLMDIFLLPPIAVFFIGLWRNFLAKMDDVFDI